MPTPPGAGGSSGSESTTPSDHNHHEGGSSGSESTTPSDHNHHEGGSAGSESTTPSDHNHHEGGSSGSESTTPSDHNHHEGDSAGSESTIPSDHNHHEGDSSGSESTTPSDHNHHEGDSSGSESTTPSKDSGSQGGASTQPANPEPSAPAASPLETGELGEKYFYGEGEITNLVINGETIDLTVADEQLSSRAKLWTDFDKIITSRGFENLIYGAAKLADGSYALFVQGKLSDSLPGGTATYSGDVLHFRSRNLTEGGNWFSDGNAWRSVGSFTAEVDFAGNSLSGEINSRDGSFMGAQKFKGNLNGNRFTGTWKNGEEGSISGGFYGDNAAEMAGRYSYNKTPDKNGPSSDNAFGVFGGKKTQ
ncbi:transferrin-binding protein-like solute binding protein [Neisseria polysaccharea]|uniref:transferrin-binding protein-like solute binding protein n=1 Tax=Neisseria polysaccharea TaxID=489 RepID=UPI0027E06DDE|nr:transferrin-binding protein-like solute binding protein [Neisseria polysaccharea]